MAAPAATSARRPWIDGPWIDLLIGCGGWSVPLLLVSYALVDRDVARWSTAFYALAIVCNYPHYMATIYRAYGRDDRGEHRLYTHYLTAALVILGAVAHVRYALVPWLFTTYILWSPWHYTGQNFGLLMMFLRRGGIDVTPAIRRRLRVAFVASYVMLMAAFNLGPSHDPMVLSLGLSVRLSLAIEMAAAFVFVAGGLAAFVPLARRGAGGRGALVAPLVLCSTQALWFVVPIVVSWVSSLSAPQTRYSSGMLALMHSAQYLWITRYFAQRDAETVRPGSWNIWTYWGILVVGGLALFLPIPWLASYGWHADFTTSVFIVASIVNIHHFMIDGVVWKLRNPRVGRVLVDTGASTAAAPVVAVSRAARHVAGSIVRVASVAGLLVLAAVDQWRYRLAAGHTDREQLEAATRINPYDSGALLRLAQAEGQAGDAAGAERALRDAVAASPQNPTPARALTRLLIEAGRYPEAYSQAQRVLAGWPDDVDTLVNAGVLAYRLSDQGAAVAWWQRALDRDPSLRPVHLYLAELLDAQARTKDALPHYRRYLELAGQADPSDRPVPQEIVPAVIKFADALARDGDRATAAGQYDLAVRLAQQTGLADLEALARERRTAVDQPGR